MSDGATLRVTPVELAGVAGQVRALERAALTGAVGLRAAAAGVQPPDATADQALVAYARATQAASGEVCELLGSLLAQLGQTFAAQAAALAAAAHGYGYVEEQVGATFDRVERRGE
jgi:hypothetical protein